jgi:hypothetical protein
MMSLDCEFASVKAKLAHMVNMTNSVIFILPGFVGEFEVVLREAKLISLHKCYPSYFSSVFQRHRH